MNYWIKKLKINYFSLNEWNAKFVFIFVAKMWANHFAGERPSRAARNGRGGSLGHSMLKTFVSGFSSGQQFKSCSRVHTVRYVNVLFVFNISFH
jgi:hypothetical protein